MSGREIDEFLSGLEPEKRAGRQTLRERILTRIPNAGECISYAIPAFREGKHVLVGFAAYKHHLPWFPHRRETPSVGVVTVSRHALGSRHTK